MSNLKYYTLEVSDKGRWVFLPAERGRYIRTHWSAFYVDYPNKNCLAEARTPCYDIKAYLSFDVLVFQAAVHKERHSAYRLWKAKTDDKGKTLKLLKRRRA